MNEERHEQGGAGQAPRSTPEAKRDLAGLLGGLLGGQPVNDPSEVSGMGASSQGFPASSDPNDISSILGGLLGGGAGTGVPQQSGGSLPGQYGGQQGSFPPQTPSGQGTGGSDLASILGGLLGGGAGGAGGAFPQVPQGGMPEQPSSGGDLLGMLGGLLGGGGSSAGSGGGLLGGLLGSVIGNDQASHTVSQQTGVAPSLVQALLPMIIGLLLRGNQRSGMRGQAIDIDGDGIPDNGDRVMDVTQRIQHGEHVDPAELRATGLTSALARQSGYSEDEVAPATVKILEALARQNR